MITENNLIKDYDIYLYQAKTYKIYKSIVILSHVYFKVYSLSLIIKGYFKFSLFIVFNLC